MNHRHLQAGLTPPVRPQWAATCLRASGIAFAMFAITGCKAVNQIMRERCVSWNSSDPTQVADSLESSEAGPSTNAETACYWTRAIASESSSAQAPLEHHQLTVAYLGQPTALGQPIHGPPVPDHDAELTRCSCTVRTPQEVWQLSSYSPELSATGEQKAADEVDEEDDPGGPGGFGGPGDEPGYGLTWYPSAAVSGQNADLGILRNRVGLDVPIWFKESNAVMATVAVDETHFSGDAILPDTMQAFPSDLWDIELGLKYMHEFANGWSSMMSVDIGSPSDKPFHAFRDMSYQLMGFLQIPTKNGRDAWTVGAMYSPSGSPAFPIPILAYGWKPTEQFHMNIGLPFDMKWRPTDKLSFDVSYIPLTNINAIANYNCSEKLRFYGGYQYFTEQYFLADRIKRQELFYAIEQRLIVGAKHDVWRNLSIDVNAGYAFDRHYGKGEDQQDLYDRVNLESGAFFAAGLNWNF